MKNFILVFIVLMSSSAAAVTVESIEKLFPSNGSAQVFMGSEEKSRPAPIPIREASVHVTFYRTDITKNPDGSFTSEDSIVCKKSATLRVFDAAQGDFSLDPEDTERVGCESSRDGETYHLNLGGAGAVNVPMGEGPVKAFMVFFYATPESGQLEADQSGGNLFATRDPNSWSFVTSLMPQVTMSCKADYPGEDSDCEVSHDFYFSALVDVEDTL